MIQDSGGSPVKKAIIFTDKNRGEASRISPAVFEAVAQYDFRGHQEMRCTLIIIFITSNYIHVVETLGTSCCVASLDSEDFASLSNELLMFNKKL